MKEDQSVFNRLRKERDLQGNRWQHLVSRDELHQGLKELSYELRGVPQQTVSLLSDMITLIPVPHADVLVEARPGGYVVNVRASLDEVKKQSLPGEEVYAMRSIIAARIESNFSDLIVYSDTETAADPRDESLASKLRALITELHGNPAAMNDTTNAVMGIVLESIKDGSEETSQRDDPFSDLIAGLKLEDL